jgi:hypothetical protein
VVLVVLELLLLNLVRSVLLLPAVAEEEEVQAPLAEQEILEVHLIQEM